MRQQARQITRDKGKAARLQQQPAREAQPAPPPPPSRPDQGF